MTETIASAAAEGFSGTAPGRKTEPRLQAQGLRLTYGEHVVSRDLDVVIPDGSFTVIVGANGCGKSTLLKALARMVKPEAGVVHLDGKEIHSLPSKEVARRLGLLPQSPIAPDGITVIDLVARGRYPHQKLLRQWSKKDEQIVREALVATGTEALAERYVDELSGGQRQRVWVAMALAQQTEIMLLDEPISYLDIAYQLDVLDLCAQLHEQRSYTLVAVLHDLNHACRYGTHLIAMREGKIVAQGPPAQIVTEDLVQEVFGLACQVIDDPQTGTPLVIPLSRERRQA